MFEKINPADFKKIGFVASGGAAKALFYHIGVTFALKERGIEFPISTFRSSRKSYIELVVGSSGGALFAAFIANGFDEVTIQQKLEEKKLWSYIVSFQKRRRGDLTGFSYADIFLPNVPLNMRDARETAARARALLGELSERSLFNISAESFINKIGSIADGVFRLDRLEKYLEDVLPVNDFNVLRNKTGIELYIIATELANPRKAVFGPLISGWLGTEEDDFYRDRYLNTAPVSRAVPASCAVPGLFKPVTINGIKYIDGETKKALSSHVAAEQGCDLIFVSHTFTPHLETEGEAPFGLAELAHQAFQILIYQKIQSHREFQLHKTKIFTRLASADFRKKVGITKEQQEKILGIYEELADFDRDRRYVFIPSPPETFHLDYFNIFPAMLNELINTGYVTANRVLDLHGIARLPEFEKTGILNNLGVATKKFRLLKKYEREKETMKIHYPKFL